MQIIVDYHPNEFEKKCRTPPKIFTIRDKTITYPRHVGRFCRNYEFVGTQNTPFCCQFVNYLTEIKGKAKVDFYTAYAYLTIYRYSISIYYSEQRT